MTKLTQWVIILLFGSLILTACVNKEEVNTELSTEKEFVEVWKGNYGFEGGNFMGVSNLISVDGKLAFIVDNNDGSFVVYDGEKIEGGYDKIRNIKSIGGKVAFNAYKNGKAFIVYDGQEIGKEYDSVVGPYDINGNLAFIADKDDKKYVIYNNEVVSQGYYYINFLSLKSVGDKIAFLAGDQMFNNFIVYDGQEIGKEYGNVYDPINIGGKLAFRALKNGKYVIIYDGQDRVGLNYDRSLGYPIDIGGKLAFSALKDGKTFVIYDGEEIGDGYYYVGDVVDIGGKLVFSARNYEVDDIPSKGMRPEPWKDGNFFVVYDGKKIGKEYDYVGGLVEIGGKLAHLAEMNDEWFVVFDGQEMQERYNLIISHPLTDISGNVAFIAQKDDQEFIVYDQEEIGKGKFDYINKLVSIGNKLAFSAIKDEKSFIFMEK